MSLQTNYNMYRVVHSEIRKMDLQVYKKGICQYSLPLPFIFNFGFIGWPLQPPTERAKKINEIVFFMIHHTLKDQGRDSH